MCDMYKDSANPSTLSNETTCRGLQSAQLLSKDTI